MEWAVDKLGAGRGAQSLDGCAATQVHGDHSHGGGGGGADGPQLPLLSFSSTHYPANAMASPLSPGGVPLGRLRHTQYSQPVPWCTQAPSLCSSGRAPSRCTPPRTIASLLCTESVSADCRLLWCAQDGHDDHYDHSGHAHGGIGASH